MWASINFPNAKVSRTTQSLGVKNNQISKYHNVDSNNQRKTSTAPTIALGTDWPGLGGTGARQAGPVEDGRGGVSESAEDSSAGQSDPKTRGLDMRGSLPGLMSRN